MAWTLPDHVVRIGSLIEKWSANPATEFPRTEWVFYVACAFRAAAAMDTLRDFFSGEMIHQLQNAREACAEIGAHAAATVLQRHIDDLAQPADVLAATHIAAGIPTQLACAGDDLYELIARYAADRVREGFSPD